MKKTKQNNTKLWVRALSWCLPLTLLTACDKDAHDGETGGLSVALAWQDESEAVDITGLRLWIYDVAMGAPVSNLQYDDVRQLSAQRFPLEAGQYRILATANLESPLVVVGTDKMDELLLTPTSPQASPQQAFYGVADVTVRGSDCVTLVTDSLRYVLAELTVTLNNAPASAVLTGRVKNAASGFYPCIADADGDYGKSHASADEVNIPAAAAQGTVLETDTLRLMPTKDGESCSRLSFHISTANGVGNDFEIEAPVMKPGRKYRITLDYHNIRPFMHLSGCTIDDWTEGWTYESEILNPEN